MVSGSETACGSKSYPVDKGAKYGLSRMMYGGVRIEVRKIQNDVRRKGSDVRRRAKYVLGCFWT